MSKVRLTKRGKRVRAILILLAIVAYYYLVSHIWWTGTGYCWGTGIECMFGE